MKPSVIYFSHGMESSPHGTKIRVLSKIACNLGFDVEALDYTDTLDPDVRAERLTDVCRLDSRPKVFVGSSMGGYVSLSACEVIESIGIFLMAPALFLDGYKKQHFEVSPEHITVIHGYRDDVIPYEHSLKFSKQYLCDFHLINSDHRLNDRLNDIEGFFSLFLNRIIKSN